MTKLKLLWALLWAKQWLLGIIEKDKLFISANIPEETDFNELIEEIQDASRLRKPASSEGSKS